MTEMSMVSCVMCTLYIGDREIAAVHGPRGCSCAQFRHIFLDSRARRLYASACRYSIGGQDLMCRRSQPPTSARNLRARAPRSVRHLSLRRSSA